MIEQKTLAEIAEEITATAKKAAKIETEIEKSENAFYSMEDAARAEYIKTTPSEARIMRKWEEQRKEVERLENLRKILTNNYNVVLFENFRPVLLYVLKKYNGKKAGQKTVEKIQNEIKDAIGVDVFFKRNYFSQKCETLEIWRAPNINLTVYTKNRKPIIFEDNTINGEILADDLPICGYSEYIENPAQRLQEIEAARAKVEEIKKQYNAAVENYQNLVVNGFEDLQQIYK